MLGLVIVFRALKYLFDGLSQLFQNPQWLHMNFGFPIKISSLLAIFALKTILTLDRMPRVMGLFPVREHPASLYLPQLGILMFPENAMKVSDLCSC